MDKNKEKIMKILSDNGIKMSIWGCGCCGSPEVSFEYNGELIIEDEFFKFDMFHTDEHLNNS